LSRARRIIENVFGILAAKFRILLRPIETLDTTTDEILRAIVGLHNFLIEFSPAGRAPELMADHGLGDEQNGRWRSEVSNPLESVQQRGRGGAHNTQSGNKIRDFLTNFVNNQGSVPWQNESI
jgi:hypothetical protein